MDDRRIRYSKLLIVLGCGFLGLVLSGVVCVTDRNDVAILREFEKGLQNSELLNWPEGDDDDPCGSKWPHVFCSGDRVAQIQVQGMGLKGPLPQNFNQLSKLSNLGLQGNKFKGSLPTFRGLSELVYAFLNENEFDSIPSDFFEGLTSLRVVALDKNPLNASTGWTFPAELKNSNQLMNVSMIQCNLVGELPDFMDSFGSLVELKLSFNRLTGGIPATIASSTAQILWLNGQDPGLTGSIDVIASMTYLTQVWLHGNHFAGVIPDMGNLTSLRELNLNGNQLVGVIPPSFGGMQLQKLDLSNNQLMGPIPKFKFPNVTLVNNNFCQSLPGERCAADVTALLDFLGAVNYPSNLASQWSGNQPCSWVGVSCDTTAKVIRINLPNHELNGTISPSIRNLESLRAINFGQNNLSGRIPDGLTELKYLALLDLSNNNFEPPLPKFDTKVKVELAGNPQFDNDKTSSPSLPDAPSPPGAQSAPRQTHPPEITYVKPPPVPNPGPDTPPAKTSGISKSLVIVAGVIGSASILLILASVFYCRKRRERIKEIPLGVVIRPKDHSDPEEAVKMTILSSETGSLNETRSRFWSGTSSGLLSSRPLDSGNVISLKILRKVTDDFAPQYELGRGGFGVVYRGTLDDGTQIAVKRMEAGVITTKAIDEFQSEICVLSKVRHRHLVSLLGYSIEGNERLLVYEYMPQGALSRHLFHWKSLKLEPLSWVRRLAIALDVARGMEYLHGLACESFIHRDLKSSNILLGDDYRAKVSDFGLVKLAPGFGKSIATRLAGTFGYLAPEYAVMGRITTKSDVFSFGVVLMELLTGFTALDETRPDESRYLAQWFSAIKSNKEKLMTAIDPTLGVNADESTVESILIVAELAGHCTTRDPSHRPDMGYAVNVLAPLVEKWKPSKKESGAYAGIDFDLPLPEMLKVWQDESVDMSFSSTANSQGSIPNRPPGFADSFASTDGR